MELIIEQAGRGSHRHAADMQKVSGDKITIGRAFDNDIILTDPHVCPHHAVIESGVDGRAQLHDLNSVNGSYDANHAPLYQPHTISSGDTYIIGRSRIRIYFPDHPVEESIKVNPVEKLAKYASIPTIAISVLVLAVLLNLFIDYSSTLGEFKFGRIIITNIGFLLAITLWPVCWAMFARFRKLEAKFIAQFTVSITLLIIGTVFLSMIDWIEFHLGINSTGLKLFYWLFTILLLACLFGINLYLAGFQINRKHFLYTAGLTLTALSFNYTLISIDSSDFKYSPVYHKKIYPPSVTLYSAHDIHSFIKATDKTFEKSAKLINKDSD
ncbi:MAG: FHA domain-containing protein [Gammaproteobacteria bacterium]|nr:FHA domain-containing protein [Gammaproteobacteria bacterium]